MNMNTKIKAMGIGLASVLGFAVCTEKDEGEVTRSAWVMPNGSYDKSTFQVIVNDERAYCIDFVGSMEVFPNNGFAMRPWNLRAGDSVQLPINGMYECEVKLPGKYDLHSESARYRSRK